MIQSTLEQRTRRLVGKLGWRLEKSRTRKHFHCNDQGGYMLIDDRNTVILGDRFELTLKDVMEFLAARAAMDAEVGQS